MQYTDDQKAEAVRLFADQGATAAARLIGCHRDTIYRWVEESSDGIKTKAEEEAEVWYQSRLRSALRRRLMIKALDMLDRMDERHKDYRGKDVVEVWWDSASSADVKNYALAFAILLDKYRLEMGEATARTEEMASHDIDHSVAQLVAELGRRGEAQAAPSALD